MWPKTSAPSGPHAEAGAERREAGEELRGLVARREEQVAEEDREAAVEIEVVPLEQRARAIDAKITRRIETPPAAMRAAIPRAPFPTRAR